MIDLDRTVLESILSAVPCAAWSALLETTEGRTRFIIWCMRSQAATELMVDILADAAVFELDPQKNGFVISLEYEQAEAYLRALVEAYEDATLERLISH